MMVTQILWSLLLVVGTLGNSPVDAGDSATANIAEANGSELPSFRSLQERERFVFVDPPWWVRLEATFEGVNLRRCFKRAVPPVDGTACATRPKTCFFGTQDCAGVPHPTTQCFCDGRSGSQTWQCAVEQCPAPAEDEEDNEVLPAPPVVGGGSLSEIVVSDVVVDPSPAIYRVTFTNTWTGTRHPVDYPFGTANWSPPVMASHNTQYSMWAEGANASPGVEFVAEAGNSSTLTTELSTAGSNVFNVEVGTGQLNSVQTSQLLAVEFDESHQYMSAVSMIAPSPDWFSGFYNLHPVTDGRWWQSFRIDTSPWDAGTEDGNTYSTENLATAPQRPISEINATTAPPTGVFVNNGEVLPVLTWTFQLMNGDDAAGEATDAPDAPEPVTEPPVTPTPEEEVLPAPAVVGGGSLSEIVVSDVAVDPSPAIYRVTFTNTWTGTRHPVDYPFGTANWSPPVMASHNTQYSMWAEGANASPGVEFVAEAGNSSTLTTELSTAGSNVFNVEVGTGQLNSVQTSQLLAVEFDESHQYMSAVSMIAPSPDWFSGFYNLHPVTDGRWWQSFRIDTSPWDAGTEDGNTYSTDNLATAPQRPISEINATTAPPTGVFVNNGEVLPVLTWTFQLMNGDDAAGEATDAPDAPEPVTEPPVTPTPEEDEVLPAPAVVGGGSLSDIVLSEVAADLTTAIYRVTLVNSWTPENHPVNFPVGPGHWTTPVLASHNTQYSMWANEEIASPGVEAVAETGSTFTLTAELGAAGSNVLNVELGTAQFTADDPQVLSVEFDPSHQYLSAVTMIAPSPDWFSGFYNLHPVTAGNYWQSFRVVSYPWDAGTENGDTYSLSNSATVPQQLISEITAATAPATGVLVNNGEVLPVITWEFELMN